MERRKKGIKKERGESIAMLICEDKPNFEYMLGFGLLAGAKYQPAFFVGPSF